MPIEIVSEEEAEKADFVVCVRANQKTPFDDNETGVCSKCGEAVQFRPHAPKTPPRLCMECYFRSQAH